MNLIIIVPFAAIVVYILIKICGIPVIGASLIFIPLAYMTIRLCFLKYPDGIFGDQALTEEEVCARVSVTEMIIVASLIAIGIMIAMAADGAKIQRVTYYDALDNKNIQNDICLERKT